MSTDPNKDDHLIFGPDPDDDDHDDRDVRDDPRDDDHDGHPRADGEGTPDGSAPTYDTLPPEALAWAAFGPPEETGDRPAGVPDDAASSAPSAPPGYAPGAEAEAAPSPPPGYAPDPAPDGGFGDATYTGEPPGGYPDAPQHWATTSTGYPQPPTFAEPADTGPRFAEPSAESGHSEDSGDSAGDAGYAGSHQHADEHHGGQPAAAELYGAGSFPAEQYGAQPDEAQQTGAQEYGVQEYGTEQYGTEQYSTEQFGTEQYGAQEYGAQPYGGDRYGTEQFGAEQYGGQQFGAEQFGGERYGTEQYGSQAYGAQPHGQDTAAPDAPDQPAAAPPPQAPYGQDQPVAHQYDPYGQQAGQQYAQQEYGQQPYGQQPYGQQPYGQQEYGQPDATGHTVRRGDLPPTPPPPTAPPQQAPLQQAPPQQAPPQQAPPRTGPQHGRARGRGATPPVPPPAAPPTQAGPPNQPAQAAQPGHPPRPEDLLVPTQADVSSDPASWGWRGRVNRASGGLFKPKAAPEEIAARNAIMRIQRAFSRPMTVVVVQPKGGAGKTPTTICLAAAFGANRGGYVVGWDDNETRGTLSVRVRNPDNHQATVWDLLSDLAAFERYDARVGDLSYYVRSQPDAHFDALVSDDNPGNMAQIGDDEFRRLHTVLQRFYRMIVVDTGNNVRSPNWQAAVNKADLVVVVSTYQRDVGFSASWVLDHLAQTGREELARNAVTVLTAADPTSDKQVREELLSHFRARTRSVVEIPYDPELAHGGPIGWTQLAPATRTAWIEAGATVADALAEQDRRVLEDRRG